jgi:phosphoribosylanthranilate isomerase
MIVEKNRLDLVQLHGDESPEFCGRLKSGGLKLIKVFRVDEEFDFSGLEDYKDVADYYLFDTRSKLYGGSGKRFNWKILKRYDQHKPFFLSGGLNVEALEDLKQLKGMNLFGLDLNSGVEVSPGLKDTRKIKYFISKLRELEHEVFSG